MSVGRGVRLAALVSLAVLAAPTGPARAEPDSIRRLPSGGSSIHFVVDVPEPRLIPFSDASASRLELDGYELAGAVGAPALPKRVVVVAVPPTGAIRLRALGAEPTALEDAVLAPMPRLVGPRGAETERYDRSPAAYAARGAAAGAVARLIGVSWLRNQRVARIAIEPASYDPPGRRVTLMRQVDVALDVEPSEVRGPLAELDDPFESIYRSVLVNYEQGRGWRRSAATALARSSRGAGPLAAQAPPDTSLYAGRLWVKLAVTQPGFYKVDFSQLRNTALFSGDTTTAYDSLRLFTWPGRPVLPEDNYCDSCSYHEVAFRYVDVTPNGMLSNNRDYLYFYALGPSDWSDVYDPAAGDSLFFNNPYETTNYYYLAISTAAQPIGGTRPLMLTVSGTPSGGPATTPATFDARVHAEVDAEYFPDATPLRIFQDMFWEKWLWRSLSIGQSFTATFDAPGMDLAQPGRLRARMWGIASYDTCYVAFVPPTHLVDFTLNGTPLTRFGWNLESGATLDTTLAIGFRTNANQLRLTVPSLAPCRLREDRSGLAWVDLFYQRKFEAVGSELAFDSPMAADTYRFVVDSLHTVMAPSVFDVTDPYQPIQITSVDYTFVPGSGNWQLSFERPQYARRRYRVVQDANIVKLPNTSVFDAPFTSLENLRGPGHGADYLVIYYDAFRAAADSLVNWRKLHLPLATKAPPYEALAIPVSALYDQFSGGRTDPAALRNFLRSTLNWRVKPEYVTLLGDASYDFKNITGRAAAGQPGALVPSYENGYDPFVFGGRQFASDDWILNVDNTADVVPDFKGGRIPVNDAASALQYVREKLFFYERNAPLGDNRNRVMFVADDDKQGASDDGLHWTHLDQTSQLDSLVTPPHVDRDYVYLHKYPDGPGDTKPGAKSDIKKDIEEGISIFNYIGHGSPFKISDEGVFLDVDTGTLTNATKLFVFMSASCDVGKFNDPAVQSLGERLILRSGGGAVGVVSATELALSSQNASLNRTIYRQIFERDSLTGTGQYFRTVAEGLLAAKLVATETSQKYELMGDAALRMNLPRLWADVTLWDSAGASPLTEVKRGQTAMLKGRVLDRPGGASVSMNGVVNLLIEDSAPQEQAPPCAFVPSCYKPKYYYRAGPVFRGDAQVTGGQFQSRFVVPLEAVLGGRGRIRAYVTGRAAGEGFDSDATGSLRTQLSPGTASSEDNEGPRITISFVGGATSVRPDAVLRVDLFDQSGILVTGHTPQNGIVVTLDDNTTARADITSSFRCAADSYQSGFATFQLPNLAPGPHRVSVSAADNLALGLGAGAHRSRASLDFEVRDNPPLNVARTYLFPDPSSSGPGGGGQFVVDAPGDSVNVLLRVYTVSGRLIRTLEAPPGIGQVQIPWDGYDGDGDRLANGVYLFKVYVYNRDPDGSSSPIRRAIGEGRFVILNR